MKKLLFSVLAASFMAVQANAVVVMSSDGSSVDGWTARQGTWESVDGAISMTATDQPNGQTWALTSDTGVDFQSLTYPVTLTYDIKAQNNAPEEVWTAVGLFAPADGAETGSVVCALRAGNGGLGLHVLVGGRQWISQVSNLAWAADTWYTIRVVLNNPNFATNKIDIDATIHEKGGEAGASVSIQGAPVSGGTFELGNTGVTLFSRNGNGGIRSFDNIVIEAANVPEGNVVYRNDGTDVSGFTAVAGVFESVGGAIVRTDPVRANTTQAFIRQGVVDFAKASAVSLEYDIKVQSLSTTSETWSGIGLFTPPSTAGNIEDGAVIMAFRDGGSNATEGRGLHSLVGGRAWALRVPNLFWKPDTWYHISVTVSNPDFATGHTDIAATLSEIGGTGATSVVLKNAPSSSSYALGQTGISLFSRSGGADLGGTRSWDNIRVVQVRQTSNVEHFESLK